MEEFKAGEYITITKSDYNWADDMDNHVGNTYMLIKDFEDTSGGTLGIFAEDKNNWWWGFKDGHFRRATQAEINKAKKGITRRRRNIEPITDKIQLQLIDIKEI